MNPSSLLFEGKVAISAYFENQLVHNSALISVFPELEPAAGKITDFEIVPEVGYTFDSTTMLFRVELPFDGGKYLSISFRGY